VASSRFLLNGANGAAPSNPLNPDSGTGWKLVPGGAGVAYSTAQVYQGSASLTSNGVDLIYFTDTAGTYGYLTGSAMVFDFFFYMTSAPGSDRPLLYSAYPGGEAGVYISPDRRIKIKNTDGSTAGQSAANTVPTGAWIRLRIDTSSNIYQGVSGVRLSVAPWMGSPSYDNFSEATVVNATATDSNQYGFISLDSGWYMDDLVIQAVADGNASHPAVAGPTVTVRTGWGVIQ
jgi:hypothetical protein